MSQLPIISDAPPAGILAEFADPAALRSAAAALMAAGYRRYEAHSPYPLEGISTVMARRSGIQPWLVLVGGIVGCTVALLLQWWTNAIDYPYWISGKPLFSLPANVPIGFELIILLGALAAFGGFLVLANLPWLRDPRFDCAEFRRVTSDGFFLSVEASDAKFDERATAELLASLGAQSTTVYRRESDVALPGWLKAGAVLLIAVALLPPLLVAQARCQRKSSPRVHLILDMDFQPKYLPQQASPLFADGRDMRPPVAGAVAADTSVDQPALTLGQIDGKPVERIPLPVTDELMRRGRQRFDIFCATCHGLAGDGDGITSQLAFEREEPKWVRPLSLHEAAVVKQPVGQLFHTITEGIRTMPSYRSQIPVADRWAIILYVRALQRSREEKLTDVPEEIRTLLEKRDAPTTDAKP
jgi:mono/diheme cytochrome c family protein